MKGIVMNTTILSSEIQLSPLLANLVRVSLLMITILFGVIVCASQKESILWPTLLF
jgi:hypothetical protein